MDEALTFTYTFIFKLFITILVILAGVFFSSRDTLGDITKHYAETTAVNGGFSSSQYDDFIQDLKDMGIDTNTAEITVKAKSIDGHDISSKALNVTDTKYCPRGTTITLIVKSNKKSILNSAFKAFGINTNIKNNYSKRVYMSERVK